MVLIHLNTRIPRYLRRNISRLQYIFPTHEIVLLSNIKQPRLNNVVFRILKEPLDSQMIKNNISHPKDFRANFWHSSIARFAYLRDYQNEINEPLIHIESDVILAEDFPVKEILENQTLAYPILSEFRGVASIFFSDSKESLAHFTEFLASDSLLDNELTDMTALRKYFDLFPERVEILPAGPGLTSVYEPEILSDIYEKLITGLQKYSGIMDGSDIGMYLFGTDPRNRLGKTLLRSEVPATYTLMSEMEFRYNPERDFLDVKSNGKWLPIYNLHMTCKDIKLFSRRNLKKIFSRYLRYDSPTELFLPKVYLRMGMNKILRIIQKTYR